MIIHNLKDKGDEATYKGLKTHDGRHVQRAIQELYCQSPGNLFAVTLHFDFVCINERQFFNDITWMSEHCA